MKNTNVRLFVSYDCSDGWSNDFPCEISEVPTVFKKLNEYEMFTIEVTTIIEDEEFFITEYIKGYDPDKKAFNHFWALYNKFGKK